MARLQIYNKLLQFPLFFGMSHSDIMELVAHYRLDFYRKAAGETIVCADSPCDKMILLANGQIESTTKSPDGSFSVEEVFNSPYTLQPENLFGTNQRYQSTFVTSTRCNFISIDKMELVVLFSKFETIRLNYLNMLANMTQKTKKHTWAKQGNTQRSHIVHFMAEHSLRPAGHKIFRILMTKLAEEINATRREVSAELNRMEDEGLLTLSRGKITVPFLERLITL
ncbi:MAG: Crp/Fnr family transcriptional regulator [Prevotella sp.]